MYSTCAMGYTPEREFNFGCHKKSMVLRKDDYGDVFNASNSQLSRNIREFNVTNAVVH